MLKLLVFSSLFLATATDAFALPLKFACETPQGKRVEQGPPGKATDSFEWIDDNLENVQPSVVIDGETFSVTWGTTIPKLEISAGRLRLTGGTSRSARECVGACFSATTTTTKTPRFRLQP